ncbi:hypothetical protein THAOC_22111 [Thalassiosira oceanica]|uniref:Uncharacterized protein n=1 Tax=Thalassiosira oceanica TaxID=159749 RepID=K0RZB7_THAOC|nr:hypothetical protein THAOC_22111 [Thalassiosira oceanica]|eukprot:EJK57814.1 hypothetical protein THAOC_22111 [Thalassiosira oceanica]
MPCGGGSNRPGPLLSPPGPEEPSSHPGVLFNINHMYVSSNKIKGQLSGGVVPFFVPEWIPIESAPWISKDF